MRCTAYFGTVDVLRVFVAALAVAAIQGAEDPRKANPGATAALKAPEQLRAAATAAPVRPAWATAVGKDRCGYHATVRIGTFSQRMRWIPPGSYVMGCEIGEEKWSFDYETARFKKTGAILEFRVRNESAHPVSITRGFWMADTEVTQELWQLVMGENPSHCNDNVRNPVDSISWTSTQEFLRKVSLAVKGCEARLPTEAEWEYACRAGTLTRWWWGDDPKQFTKNENIADASFRKGNYIRMELAMVENDGFMQSAPVASFRPNPWGLYDMSGNVAEWCSDWYSGDHEVSHLVDPVGAPRGEHRIVRGGRWFEGVHEARSAYRTSNKPDAQKTSLGMRFVISAGP